MTQEFNKESNTSALAVSVLDQQKASLYGIASSLVAIEGIPKRKSMKKVVKTLRKDLYKSIGIDGAKELMMQNKSAVDMAFIGIRKFPHHTEVQKKALIAKVVNDLLPSYYLGVEKVLGGKS